MANASASSAFATEVLAVQRSVSLARIDGNYWSLLKIVLQYHAQCRYLSVPTLLFSTSWVWEFLFKFQRMLTKFSVMELVAWWEVCPQLNLLLNRCSHASTRHPVISIEDVIPRCATIDVHVWCSLRGGDGSTEEAQSLLHCVCCVSPSIKTGNN
jgi:hypothetical protein